LTFEVDDNFLVLLSRNLCLLFGSDLSREIFQEQLAQHKALTRDDAHVAVDFHRAGRFRLLLPEIVESSLVALAALVIRASSVIWRPLDVVLSSDLRHVLLRLGSVEWVCLVGIATVRILDPDVRIANLDLLLTRAVPAISIFHVLVRVALLTELRVVAVMIQ
jgi:hypothetical protein